ncbi:hypothetical protein T439DRAFT_349194, partial [Meredithblackwellia eburnea MCA 4105]
MSASGGVQAERLYRLQVFLYPEPSRGFLVRCSILVALLGVCMIMLLGRTIILGIESWRRRQRPWIWRWVKVPGGTYLVTNQGPLGTFFSLVSSTCFLVFILDQYNIYANKAAQNQAATWRSCVWTPMLMQGWFLGWSTFQSHLVIAESRGKKWHEAVAPWSTRVFLSSSVIFFALLVTAEVVGSYRWGLVWHGYLDMKRSLESLSPDAPLPLQQFLDFSAAVTRFSRVELGGKCMILAIRILSFLINIASLVIYLHFRSKGSPDNSIDEITLRDSNSMAPAPTPTTLNVEKRNSKLMPRSPRTSMMDAGEFDIKKWFPEPEDLQEEPEQKEESNGGTKEMSKNSVVTTLAVVITSIGLSIPAFAWSIAVPAVTLNPEMSHVSRWTATELSSMLNIWTFSFLLCVSGWAIVSQDWKSLPDKDTGTPTVAPAPDTLEHVLRSLKTVSVVPSHVTRSRSRETEGEQPFSGVVTITLASPVINNSVDGIRVISEEMEFEDINHQHHHRSGALEQLFEHFSHHGLGSRRGSADSRTSKLSA